MTALALARADERRRLRDDVHDRLAPLLTGINFGLAALRTQVDGELAVTLDALHAQTREAAIEVSRVINGLSPHALDDGDLAGALRAHARRCEQAGGPEIHVGPCDGVVPAPVAATAYEIALEAINNAVRHAGASRIDVELERCDDALEVRVTDDGCGVDVVVTPGVGLSSMRRRAERAGGRLTIETRHGAGTRVGALLPLHTKKGPME